MTRFLITLEQGIDLVFFAFNDMIGGELYISKIPSVYIKDIPKMIKKNQRLNISELDLVKNYMKK